MIGFLIAFAGGCFLGLALACVFVGAVRDHFTIPEFPSHQGPAGVPENTLADGTAQANGAWMAGPRPGLRRCGW